MTDSNITKRECLHCKREFEPVREWQKFCLTKCKDAYHVGQVKRNKEKLDQIREILKEE